MNNSRNRVRAIVLAIALAVPAVGVVVYRNNQQPCIATQEKVLPGETLQGIAKESLIGSGKRHSYTDITNFVVDIQVASGLSSDQVHEGQAILVPNPNC